MPGYQDDAEQTAEVDARRLLPHRRRRAARRRRLHHLRRPRRRRVQGLRLPHQPVRARERADRARGGRRGRGRAEPRPAPARRAQGLRDSARRLRAEPRAGARRSSHSRATGWRRTSASAASSSRELPKTISGKIRRVELRQRESSAQPGERGALEFWEEDFRNCDDPCRRRGASARRLSAVDWQQDNPI